MEFSGLQKLAMVDYPGKLAATVFTGGCNLRCPFCHNAVLVLHPDRPSICARRTYWTFSPAAGGFWTGWSSQAVSRCSTRAPGIFCAGCGSWASP